jgi:DNA-binding MarR family transcriptional regulator
MRTLKGHFISAGNYIILLFMTDRYTRAVTPASEAAPGGQDGSMALPGMDMLRQSPNRPRGTAPVLDPDAFLPERLARLGESLDRALARLCAARGGLGPAEWRLLAALARYGPMPAAAVAGRTGLDKVRVSRAAARAERAGLIARRPDGADRRRAMLAPTAEGMALHDRVVPGALALEAALVAGLDPGEVSFLADLLDRLDARARHLGEDGDGTPGMTEAAAAR